MREDRPSSELCIRRYQTESIGIISVVELRVRRSEGVDDRGNLSDILGGTILREHQQRSPIWIVAEILAQLPYLIGIDDGAFCSRVEKNSDVNVKCGC